PQIRRRGLYEVPVYTATVQMEGRFRPRPSALPIEAGAVLAWGEAVLLGGGGRLVAEAPALRWGGRDLPPLERGRAWDAWDDCVPARVLAWSPGLAGAPSGEDAIPFSLALSMRGSQRFTLLAAPSGGSLSIAAAWPTPSFIGDQLPERSVVEANGFDATWILSPDGGAARRSLCGMVEGGAGVQLLEAVPTYRMVSRASKYAMLFLALAFITYVLFELLAGLQLIHGAENRERAD
ncbi:inner membrane CreD family protein, partial [Aphanothece microscopica]|uniref:inner membrane CreD family protein n=1 Tax=Aphanothece microscopica TaxID=1049561 RepID=UPI0039848933